MRSELGGEGGRRRRAESARHSGRTGGAGPADLLTWPTELTPG